MMYRNWHAPYLAKVSTAHSKIKSSCSRYSFPQNFQILKQIFFPQKVKILKDNAEIQGRARSSTGRVHKGEIMRPFQRKVEEALFIPETTVL